MLLYNPLLSASNGGITINRTSLYIYLLFTWFELGVLDVVLCRWWREIRLIVIPPLLPDKSGLYKGFWKSRAYKTRPSNHPTAITNHGYNQWIGNFICLLWTRALYVVMIVSVMKSRLSSVVNFRRTLAMSALNAVSAFVRITSSSKYYKQIYLPYGGWWENPHVIEL